jgi:hemolysin activation/secretion protein
MNRLKHGCDARLYRWFVVCAMAFAAGSVCAQAARAPAATPAPFSSASAAAAEIIIRGFQINGDDPLGSGQSMRALAPFLRQPATIELLESAAAAYEQALRDRGFGLYRVALPPQQLSETVTLNILRFAVGQVSVEGNTRRDAANVRASLPELREGTTPNIRKLAIQTAIANENPSKQVQVTLRESPNTDQVDATVTVRDSQPWSFGLSASNAGSEATGRNRLTVFGSHSNVFNLDQQFVGAYTTAVDNPSGVQQLGLSYRVPLYSAGAVIGASYTRSDVVGDFGAFTSTGAGHTLAVDYTLYRPPEGGRRSYFTFGIDDKVFEAVLINGVPVPGQVSRRSRPVRVGYSARTESDDAISRYSMELALNTGSGSGNDLASYQTEDPRISTVRWKALRGSAQHERSLASSWVLGLRAQWQYSPDTLISAEQFGLGGVGSVRGTREERPISGDRGIAGSAEITSPAYGQGLRFLAFVDAGWLGNNAPTTDAKPSSDIIGSVGLGLRYGVGAFTLAADYGRLVKGSKVGLQVNSAAPQKGDDRLYLNLSVRF